MELLTVISILATLAALLFPVYLNLRTRTDITICADQLRQIGIALKMYAHDYGDDTPYGMPYALAYLFPDYLRSKRLFWFARLFARLIQNSWKRCINS
jgi:hypothetical protein